MACYTRLARALLSSREEPGQWRPAPRSACLTTNTFARADPLLGVCEALGEDLRFNPFWLRIALTAGMPWSPAAMIGGYLAAGMAVLLVRRLTQVRPMVAAAAPQTGDNDDGQVVTAMAA